MNNSGEGLDCQLDPKGHTFYIALFWAKFLLMIITHVDFSEGEEFIWVPIHLALLGWIQYVVDLLFILGNVQTLNHFSLLYKIKI